MRIVRANRIWTMRWASIDVWEKCLMLTPGESIVLGRFPMVAGDGIAGVEVEHWRASFGPPDSQQIGNRIAHGCCAKPQSGSRRGSGC